MTQGNTSPGSPDGTRENEPTQNPAIELTQAFAKNARGFRNKETGEIKWALQDDHGWEEVLVIPNVSNEAIDFAMNLGSCNEPENFAKEQSNQFIEKLQQEVQRLTTCLHKANEQMEHFERLWYLKQQELEDLVERGNGYPAGQTNAINAESGPGSITSLQLRIPPDWETEVLDWVSACQSSYLIENSPNHRFSSSATPTAENREGLLEYLRGVLSYAQVRAS